MINEKQMQLLSCLRENSRQKLTKISRKTKIPISTLFDTMKRFRGDIIKKNTVILDFEKLGFLSRAQVILKVPAEKKDKFVEHLVFHENVNNLHKINNGWDFMIETIHRSIRDLDLFLVNLSEKFGIEEHKIFYLMEEIKREGFSPKLVV